MTMAMASVDEEARDVARQVLRTSAIEGAPVTIVDSPPGAGKTWLVEQAVALSAGQLGMSVCCALPGKRSLILS